MESDDSINEENLLNEIISEIKPSAASHSAAGKEPSKDILHPVVRQQLRQPRCKSNIWIYFERLDTGVAKCRICQNNYRFGSSISNLRHHAEVKHCEILREGPVKFLEKLKVPKEHLKDLIHPQRKSVNDVGGNSNWPHRNKKRKLHKFRHSNNDGEGFFDLDCVKREVNHENTNSVGFDETDINRALESIYQNSEDTINNYLQSPSSNGNDSQTNAQFERLDSSNHDFAMQNGQVSEEDAMHFSNETLNFNSPNMSTYDTPKIQRLKEERIRAETNYFNKKAAFMERNAEYVEAQRQHVLLQSKKLKMEIATMRQSYLHS